MNVFVAAILLLTAAAIAITATVTAVLAFRRGEGFWKTLKAWLVGMFDAISGVG
jgi:Spy/CpxP family protein refolding chaperone